MRAIRFSNYYMHQVEMVGVLNDLNEPHENLTSTFEFNY
jgi:hypothetical protein